MACTPWPGQYPNPLQYYSPECGYVDEFCARPFGSSCEQWAAHCDVVAEQTIEECPPAGGLRAAAARFLADLAERGRAWIDARIRRRATGEQEPRTCPTNDASAPGIAPTSSD